MTFNNCTIIYVINCRYNSSGRNHLLKRPVPPTFFPDTRNTYACILYFNHVYDYCALQSFIVYV